MMLLAKRSFNILRYKVKCRRRSGRLKSREGAETLRCREVELPGRTFNYVGCNYGFHFEAEIRVEDYALIRYMYRFIKTYNMWKEG